MPGTEYFLNEPVFEYFKNEVDGLKDNLNDKADVIIGTASGSIAHFEDGANADAVSVIAHIGPVQDLHGYGHPWVGGSGRNKLENNCADATFTAEGGTVTTTVNPDRSLTINSDATSTVIIYGNIQTGFVGTGAGQNDGKKHLANGTYKVSPLPSGVSIQVYGTSAESGTGDLHRISVSSSGEFTIDDTYAYNYCRLAVSGLFTDQVVYPMIRLASDTDDTYEPYSNICPITGHTGTNVTVSPTTDAQDGEAYPITFPTEAGTVYGGYVDVTNGELVVDRANIASYSGQTLPGEWISDRDVYTPDGTPTTGAQVVYKLAEPVVYNITPQQITTLLGTNNVWNDANGETEVEYRADTKLYIEQLTKPTDASNQVNA